MVGEHSQAKRETYLKQIPQTLWRPGGKSTQNSGRRWNNPSDGTQTMIPRLLRARLAMPTNGAEILGIPSVHATGS